jgi:type II secretory pathway pseudopilin PulG
VTTRFSRLALACSNRGISLVEMTVVLLAISILTGVSAPTARRALDRARVARAVTDVTAIKTAIINFLTDLNAGGFTGFTQTGASGGATTDTLVSDGDIPTCTVVVANALTGCVSGSASWIEPVDGATTDFLERHLVTNLPGNSVANDYPIGAANWRGAYINAPVDPDPWGNRYVANVKWLKDNSQCGTRSNDTIVLSAGPDESIETRYRFDLNAGLTAAQCTANTGGTGGAFVEGDDIMVVVKRDAATTALVP